VYIIFGSPVLNYHAGSLLSYHGLLRHYCVLHSCDVTAGFWKMYMQKRSRCSGGCLTFRP